MSRMNVSKSNSSNTNTTTKNKSKNKNRNKNKDMMRLDCYKLTDKWQILRFIGSCKPLNNI